MYWSQIFILPKKVIQTIQAACRTFLWTGKADMSRRALVAWEKICQPIQAGGLGIIKIEAWNKAAICKQLWNVEQKKDKIWVKWVHGFYIKGRDIYEMSIPQQSAWVIRKIFGAREYLKKLPDGREWIQQNNFSIRKLYKAMLGDPGRVNWSKLVNQNRAPPKCIFVSWLLMHERLVTVEYLQRIGIVVDSVCCFCKQANETLEHLFFGCSETGRVWTEVTAWCGQTRARQEWNIEREHLISQCRTKNGTQCLYRCVVAVVIYHIWRERNQRRMQGVEESMDRIIYKCKCMIVGSVQRDEKLRRLIPIEG